MSNQQRVYRALFQPASPLERAVSWFLASCIIGNVFVIATLTMPSLAYSTAVALERINHGFVAIFTIEYLLRVWACTAAPQWRGSISGRARYMRGFFPLADLLAILPALLPLFGGVNLEALRVIRFLRILTIMRLGRYSTAMQLFGRVAFAKRGEFGALLIIVAMILLFAASIMYFLEHEAQPEVFSSIPASLWWGIVTLTTIGYGDVTPITTFGRIVGGLIALLGVGVAALPAGIMASGLHEAVVRKREESIQPATDEDAVDDLVRG